MSESMQETKNTQGESMADFEQELNASFRKIAEGDLVTGTVIGVTESEVTVDLKYYTAGIIKASELSNDPSFSAGSIWLQHFVRNTAAWSRNEHHGSGRFHCIQ